MSRGRIGAKPAETDTKPKPSLRHSTPVTHPPLTVLSAIRERRGTFHRTTRLSRPPETMRVSSLFHVRSRTAFVCTPERVKFATARVAGGYVWMFVAFISNVTMLPSLSPVAIVFPNRLNRAAFTAPIEAHIVPTRAPVFALMMCTCRFVPAAIHVLFGLHPRTAFSSIVSVAGTYCTGRGCHVAVSQITRTLG